MEKIGLRHDSPRVIFGSLFTGSGVIVEDVSLLIDGDILFKWGSYEDICVVHDKLVKTFISSGLSTDEISLIYFDRYSSSDFTINDICYILRRCLEFTGSGFASKLRTIWESEEFLR